jgi:flagellar biosynthetic protein FlhB
VSEAQGDKRFDPTQHRREQFRKEGRYARARDASALAACFGTVGVLLGSRAGIGDALRQLFRASHGHLDSVAQGGAPDGLRIASVALATLAGPTILVAAGGSFVVGLAQAGLHLNLDALSFKGERLDPVARLAQLFSPKKAAVEVILSLLRVGVVGYVAYRAIILELPVVLTMARMSVDVSLDRIVDAIVRVTLSAGGALAAIALVDYAQSRFSLEQQMKMTRQELTEETRQQDGDPKIKGRVKARARALAKKRALQNIKKAAVVVTNPTHVAVALRYDEKDAAPVVVAKGHDDDALRIRAEARKYGVPILENRPLARALDAETPLGQPVPVAHFAAVARVLAFVYRIKGRHRRPARAVRRHAP